MACEVSNKYILGVNPHAHVGEEAGREISNAQLSADDGNTSLLLECSSSSVCMCRLRFDFMFLSCGWACVGFNLHRVCVRPVCVCMPRCGFIRPTYHVTS